MMQLIAVLGVVLVAAAATSINAQQPATPSDPHHEATPTAPSPGVSSAPASEGTAGGMMPMEMCRQMMMGGHMMGGMMGMPMGANPQQMDPKMLAQMMEMHGEMMKAMGAIMMKHARKMQGMGR